MDFKALKESSELKFINIEEIPQNTIRVKEKDLTVLCKDLSVNLVFYTSKSMKEVLRDLAPNTFDEISDYNDILRDILIKLNGKMSHFQDHPSEYNKLKCKLQTYNYFLGFIKEDDIVEYQIFVPFNGVFLTFDACREERLSSINDINDFLK